MKKVIFITGWATDNSIWNKVTRNVQFEYEILTFSQCLNFNNSQNKLHCILENTEEKLILTGWSLGGLIALNASLIFEEKIEKVILVSSTAKMPSEKRSVLPSKIETNRYIGTDLRLLKSMKKKLSYNKNEVINNFFKKAIKDPDDSKYLKDLLETAKSFTIDELKSGLDYLIETDLRNMIKKSKLQFHLIHGLKDKIIMPEQSKYLSKIVPNNTLDLIPEADHLLPINHPNKILKNIQSQ